MPARRRFLAGATVATLGAALPGGPAQDHAPDAVVRLAAHTAHTAQAAVVARPAIAARPAAAAQAARRPNIILINADDLGYGMLGAYGQRLVKTPNLDRLAAGGIRFTDAYSGAPLCAPSRAALLTGRHIGHGRVRQNPHGGQPRLAAGDTTFAEVLRTRGYRTAVIGKWGFGPDRPGTASHPNKQGFQEFYGHITHGHAQLYYPTYLWHNGRKETLKANQNGRKGTYTIDRFEKRSLAYISDHAKEPFMLYLAPTVPHAPGDVPTLGQYAKKRWTRAQKAHAWQITRLDTLVGRIVTRLRQRGLLGSTLLVFTGDNGPHTETGRNGASIGRLNPDIFRPAGRLRGYKRNLYEGGIRVPLIASWPGHLKPGAVRRPTQQIDLLPTFAELAGAAAPRGVDGRSLAPLLRRDPRTVSPAPYLYWYRNEYDSTAKSSAAENGRGLRLAEAVRSGKWKLVRYAPGRDRTVPDKRWTVELYDLGKDIGETRNVASKHPHVVARLVAAARRSWTNP